MQFLPEENIRLETLCKLYIQIKGIILYSEEIDPDAKANLQIMKELRDAFDHLMRILYHKYHTDESQPLPEYVTNNIDKSIGHVYRAGCDALDGTALSLRLNIQDLLKRYPIDVIVKVMPNYWENKASINKIILSIPFHRQKKDVNSDISKVFNEYVKEIEKLKIIYQECLDNGPNLEELLQHKYKETKRGKKIK